MKNCCITNVAQRLTIINQSCHLDTPHSLPTNLKKHRYYSCCPRFYISFSRCWRRGWAAIFCSAAGNQLHLFRSKSPRVAKKKCKTGGNKIITMFFQFCRINPSRWQNWLIIVSLCATLVIQQKKNIKLIIVCREVTLICAKSNLFKCCFEDSRRCFGFL